MRSTINTVFNCFEHHEVAPDLMDAGAKDREWLIDEYLKSLSANECFELIECFDNYEDFFESFRAWLVNGAPITMDWVRMKVRGLDVVRHEINELIEEAWRDQRAAA